MPIEHPNIREHDLIRLTSDVVSAYVSNNVVPANDIAAVIRSVHAALQTAGSDASATTQKPAVPIKKSVHDDYLVCLEDGAKVKMLKRYLRSRYSLTPDEYRQKWGLHKEYPMVAPNYARLRSAFAKKFGLGKSARNTKRQRRGS